MTGAESAKPIYVDEDVPVALASEQQAHGYQAVATERAGNKGLRDAEQLAYAWRQGMTLVTCNAKDFALLHEAWTLWPVVWGISTDALPHEGILVIPSGSRADCSRLATVIHQFLTSGESPRNRYFRWTTSTGWREGTR